MAEGPSQPDRSGTPDQPRSGITRQILRLLGRIARWFGRAVRGEVVRRVGGPARARVIVLFAAVLALDRKSVV